MATTMNPAIDYHELIHEDRIHGSLYRDPDIFEEEFSEDLVPLMGLRRPRE